MDGETLKAARTALGLTQEQLAEALGVPRVTLTRWEIGTVAIRHGQLVALALEALKQGWTAKGGRLYKKGRMKRTKARYSRRSKPSDWEQ